MKKVLEYVADTEHHDLSDVAALGAAVALFGGAVLYLVALSALRRRNIGGWNVQRLVASAALLLLLPVAAAVPAVAALAVLPRCSLGLIAFEAVVPRHGAGCCPARRPLSRAIMSRWQPIASRGHAPGPLSPDTCGRLRNGLSAVDGQQRAVWGGCWCMGFHTEGLSKDRTAA